MSPVVRMSAAAATAGAASLKNLQSPAMTIKAEVARPTARGGRRRVPGANKIVNDQLPGFSRQLAAMLSAGMPIVASLAALEEQTDNPRFRPVIGEIREAIEGGLSLSEAMARFPSIFDELYVNMVKGGETGGQLAETVGRLAGFLEASARLKRRVKSAMMYPTIVLCISIALAIAMIAFIVPVFGEMYADFGAKLPGPTQFLLNLSGLLRSYGLYILAGIAVAVVSFKKWKATPAGGLAFDQFVLKVPVFGVLTSKVASARFARTFGQLIRSGVPILNALEIVSGATGSKVAAGVVHRARSSVEKGEPLSSAMLKQTVFPIMLVRMLQAGEKTGNIDQMMDNIADFYDDEVETMLAGLTSLLEPLLMVFLGVIIGGIVLCMFLPIFKMGEVVSQW